MPALHSISIATDNGPRYEIEHGHDVADRLQGIARSGLFFIALSSCNGRRAELCNLQEFRLDARDLQ